MSNVVVVHFGSHKIRYFVVEALQSREEATSLKKDDNRTVCADKVLFGS